MAISLITTISGEFANSYVDVAYADEYFGDHYVVTKATAWAAVGATAKERLLIAACRVLDTARFTNPVEERLLDYTYNRHTGRVELNLPDELNPVRYDRRQALQFPRNLDLDATGAAFIPEQVKMAQCEQAVYLLTFDESALATRIQGVSFEKVSLGKGQVETLQRLESGGSALSPLALEYVKPFLIRSGARLQRA